MLVKWCKGKRNVVYYVTQKAEIGPFGIGIPMKTVGYSDRFSLRMWWGYQKTVLITACNEYLTKMLEV